LKKAQLEVASLKGASSERQSGLVCGVFLFGNTRTLHVHTSFSFHLSFKWLPLKSRKAAVCDPDILEACPFIFSGWFCTIIPAPGPFLVLLTAYS